MANFKTHLMVAASISGVVTIATLSVRLATPLEGGVYFALGTMGGLLPDIDADNSIPIRLFFNFLALSIAFLSIFKLLYQYSIVELFIVWAAIYGLIRYAVFEIFTRLTVHRGVFHSLLAVVFFTLLITNMSYHLLAYNLQQSWLSGLFIGLGYLVHLSLDELYSVDLLNARLKRSFGTALKPISLNNLKTSFLMLALTSGLFYICPDFQGLQQKIIALHQQETPESSSWFPKDNQWFSKLPSGLITP